MELTSTVGVHVAWKWHWWNCRLYVEWHVYQCHHTGDVLPSTQVLPTH